MKKKLMAVCAVLCMFACGAAAQADEASITSNMNLTFNNDEQEAAFYAEDVKYLQREIIMLFKEMEEKR